MSRSRPEISETLKKGALSGEYIFFGNPAGRDLAKRVLSPAPRGIEKNILSSEKPPFSETSPYLQLGLNIILYHKAGGIEDFFSRPCQGWSSAIVKSIQHWGSSAWLQKMASYSWLRIWTNFCSFPSQFSRGPGTRDGERRQHRREKSGQKIQLCLRQRRRGALARPLHERSNAS
jgi:hypothetical protein